MSGGTGALAAYLRDPRLAPHAIGPLPAWLWSSDASHLIWANPTGAAVFGAATPATIAGSAIDPKGTAALQIARLAGTLVHGAAPRLERLRGFGGRLGQAVLCACSRVTLADRTAAILVLATEPAGLKLSLQERARRVLTGIASPTALFGGDGQLLEATPAGAEKLTGLRTLQALGVQALADIAQASGASAGKSYVGPVSIQRIGRDADTALLIAFESASGHAEAPAAEVQSPAPAAVSAEAAPGPEPINAVEPIQPPLPASGMVAPEPKAPPASPAPQSGPPERRHSPHRFGWHMDADGRFTLTSNEFVALLGPRAIGALNQSWADAAAELAIDSDGRVGRAIASRDTWSGITVSFPVEGTNERLAVELSGLPIFDRERNFLGYRGFGICRDAARLAALLELRQSAPTPSEPAPSETAPTPPQSSEPPRETRYEPPVLRQERPTLTVVPQSENVLPFRASTPDKQPSLTPVERKAFREIATRLSERLRGTDEAPPIAPVEAEPLRPAEGIENEALGAGSTAQTSAPANELPPEQSAAQTAPTNDQHPVLERLPIGVLVYRIDRLIYANRAFLDWTGYGTLQAITEAGGLDALFVEPSADALGDKSGSRPLSIATKSGERLPVEARLFSSPWEGESALVLMITRFGDETRGADAASRESQAEAHELRTILEAATDGILVLDHENNVVFQNHSAGAIFGHGGRELVGLALETLFAPESQRLVADFLHTHRAGETPTQGCEAIGRTRNGRLVPLFLTAGRIADGRGKLVLFVRDMTAWKKAEEDLLNARHRAEMASSAKSDFLAKISHEIRTPLNAIIGFSEVMMSERFGAIGNERYKQYLKDIHASGEHLISLLNDLIDLSKIEAGRLDLNFTSVDLNQLIEQCVALMQPQANRERVIIRMSLTPGVPPVIADARSVRQIVLNLLSNSIKFTAAGGQVIISTALNDHEQVALRVRDTGIGMSEKDIAVALEPFRQLATSVRPAAVGSGLGLPLTKALAEANRASFRIRSAVNAGTLVEVAFTGARIAAE